MSSDNVMRSMSKPSDEQPRWVLQICHGYDGPFMDCARQYAALFHDTDYKVYTVYLTGAEDEAVRQGSASDQVVFLEYSSRQLRGMKFAAIKAIAKIAKAHNFAFCIAHRFKPTYIALLGTALPVIGIQHAFGVYRRRSRRLLANVFRKRLMLLSVSNAVRDDVRECLPSWPPERIETLYNRIDVGAVQAEQLPRAEARKALGLPASAWVVGNVGRLHSDKDQATLIKGYALALPELPDDSLLVIIGTGKLEADLKRLAGELDIADRVMFMGQVPQARRYFKAFDVFALTSDHEPFGMVLLEAMAAGVQVIATDCGGAKEIVLPEALFELGNQQQLANLILSEFAVGRPISVPDKFTDEAATKVFMSLFNMRWDN